MAMKRLSKKNRQDENFIPIGKYRWWQGPDDADASSRRTAVEGLYLFGVRLTLAIQAVQSRSPASRTR
jgi:hypothetical protein